MSTLKLFSITNGAEIIGKVVLDEANKLVVEHPLVIRPVQRGPTEFALDLFPHSLTNPEGTHTFFYSSIVSVSHDIP